MPFFFFLPLIVLDSVLTAAEARARLRQLQTPPRKPTIIMMQ